LDIYEEREGKAATLMVQIITIDADAKADSSGRPGSQNVAERGRTWQPGIWELRRDLQNGSSQGSGIGYTSNLLSKQLAILARGLSRDLVFRAQIPDTPECLASGLSRDLPVHSNPEGFDVSGFVTSVSYDLQRKSLDWEHALCSQPHVYGLWILLYLREYPLLDKVAIVAIQNILPSTKCNTRWLITLVANGLLYKRRPGLIHPFRMTGKTQQSPGVRLSLAQ
jgi:hypothetical protein